jgi:nicotinamidase-related amidase
VDGRLQEWSLLLDPGQTTVLVVDVQKQFTQVIGPRLFPPVEDVLGRMRRFVDGAIEAGVPVVRIRVVVGLTTDVCVGSTARDAFRREYNVVTLSNCTAEQTRARHEAALETLGARFGLVCTSDDVLRIWSARPAPARV